MSTEALETIYKDIKKLAIHMKMRKIFTFRQCDKDVKNLLFNKLSLTNLHEKHKKYMSISQIGANKDMMTENRVNAAAHL